MEKNKIPNIDKLIGASYHYLNNVLTLLAMFWVMRLFDVFVLARAFSFPLGMVGNHLMGIVYDTYFVLKVAGVFMFPYFLLTLLRVKIARGLFVITGVVLILINLTLLFYFASTKVMLSSDLFGYSASDIVETLQAAGSLTLVNTIPFVVFPLLYWVLQHYISRIKFPNAAYYVFYPLVAVALLTSGYSVASASFFSNSFEASLATNKVGYLGYKTLGYIDEIERTENARKGAFAKETSSYCISSNDYVSQDYPLLRIDNTPDVLSPFFDTIKVKPNIVFIIVESLGRAYSGEDAELGSFTPFLDSLSRAGLYFDNCLSAGGRSFAVLPSLLGSLPLVNGGFMELGNDMPNHQTLLSLLHANGYQSCFVYGGNSDFDNMRQFLERQNVGKIIDCKNFRVGFEKMALGKAGNSGDYGDMEVLSKLSDLLTKDGAVPTVSIVMTLSNHNPFQVKNQQEYYKRFEEILKNAAIPDDRKKFVAEYKKQLSTVLYFDESLRHFFKKIEKQPSFRNTIFVITGDHRMPEVPMGTQIDRFRVPLLVYSPMHKRSARFRSVSTQFDVTPSLVAFLRGKEGMQFSRLAHWVGAGLDTLRSFRNLHSVPLMENKNEQTCYLDGLNFTALGKLYTITSRLGLVENSNPKLLDELTAKLNSAKNVGAFVCSNNRLVPDSLLVPSGIRAKRLLQKSR